LHFDQLRAFDPGLVRTYCLAKLIEVALIQCLHEEAITFSPWGVPRCRRGRLSLWRLTHLRRLDLTLAIYRSTWWVGMRIEHHSLTRRRHPPDRGLADPERNKRNKHIAHN